MEAILNENAHKAFYSVLRTIQILDIKVKLCTPYNKLRVSPNSSSILDNIEITMSN